MEKNNNKLRSTLITDGDEEAGGKTCDSRFLCIGIVFPPSLPRWCGISREISTWTGQIIKHAVEKKSNQPVEENILSLTRVSYTCWIFFLKRHHVLSYIVSLYFESVLGICFVSSRARSLWNSNGHDCLQNVWTPKYRSVKKCVRWWKSLRKTLVSPEV